MTQTIEQLSFSEKFCQSKFKNGIDRQEAISKDWEQLTVRVRELEEEKKELQALLDFDNARLDQIEDELEDVEYLGPYVEGIKVLKTQLAASQLRETQLRKALEAVIKVHEYESGIPVEAISTQASTEALDKYVAEKVKEAGKFDMWKTNPYTKVLETSNEQLTKQRDLAVEALEKWDMFFGGDAETAVLTIAEDPSTLTGCQKATKEALSAIKESEAK